jgi:hypothetical protein
VDVTQGCVTYALRLSLGVSIAEGAMFCKRCRVTFPDEGTCPFCGEGRPDLQAPPPAVDPGIASAWSAWRQLGPVAKAVCVLLGIGLVIPILYLKKEIKGRLVPGNTFVIENRSGQLISTATISLGEDRHRRAERDIVRFENVPVDGELSRSARRRVSHAAISIEGRLADGTPFSGYMSSTPSNPYRIIIKPRGEIVFTKPAPAADD